VSNTLTDLRNELANLLNDASLAAPAYATVPEEAGPPLLAVAGGRPYLSFTEPGTAYGCAIVRLQVLAVGENGENEAEDEELDALILDVLATLAGTRFTAEQVDQPLECRVNGQAHLGVPIDVWTEVDLRT
jgi:hypothetical protein